MKFVVAPDKFKGSLTGVEFCQAAEIGLRKVFPDADIINCPMADGGDGTLEAVKYLLKAKEKKVSVHNPIFKNIAATYLLSKDEKSAFIEMSEASGLKLLKKSEYNCIDSSSIGTGELIKNALDRNIREIILGIGGSATTDGGIGIASALGYEFFGDNDTLLHPTGRNLIKIRKIDAFKVDKRLSQTRIKVACDVSNPFHGSNGAAYIYAPQKGASDEEVKLLDAGLKNLAEVINTQIGVDVQKIPGAGAAGGVGGGAVAFLNATLLSGIDLIKEIANFDEVVKDADWIITGEGKLDAQTLSGKTIFGILESAKRQNIPVAAFCGAVNITPKQQSELGLGYAISILKDISNLEEAQTASFENLVCSVFNFASVLKIANPPA